jgi:hypothetical protein
MEGDPKASDVSELMETVRARLQGRRAQDGGPAGAGHQQAAASLDLAGLRVALTMLDTEQLAQLLAQLPPHQLARALERALRPDNRSEATLRWPVPAPEASEAPAQPEPEPPQQAPRQQTETLASAPPPAAPREPEITPPPVQTPPPAAAPQPAASPEPASQSASTPSTEHRLAARHKAFRAGKIIYNNSMSVANCEVRDMSATGCRITVESIAGIPDTFILQIKNGGARHVCEVAWRKFNMMGLRFIDDE